MQWSDALSLGSLLKITTPAISRETLFVMPERKTIDRRYCVLDKKKKNTTQHHTTHILSHTVKPFSYSEAQAQHLAYLLLCT